MDVNARQDASGMTLVSHLGLLRSDGKHHGRFAGEPTIFVFVVHPLLVPVTVGGEVGLDELHFLWRHEIKERGNNPLGLVAGVQQRFRQYKYIEQ